MSYASASDVAAYTPNLLSGGDAFTKTSRPTAAAVARFLSAGCSLIHTRLEAAGYSVPVSNTTAVYDQIVDLEALYAAGRAEMVAMTARTAPTERTRSQMFMSEFNAGMDRLMKMDLSRLGVGADSSKMAAGGWKKSERDALDADTDRIQTRFRRGQFQHPGTGRPGVDSDDFTDY